MKVLGLCGGSGSGKGVVCSYFAELGLKTVDTDQIYHNLTSSMTLCLAEIAEAFGPDVVRDGALDRKRLSEIVFASPALLQQLNKIAHKHILSEVRNIIDRSRNLGCIGIVIDAPLLFESGFDRECDSTLCILAPTELRTKRIMARDGITPEVAQKRINAQKSNEWLKEKCEFSICNDTTTENLKKNVFEVAKIIFDI